MSGVGDNGHESGHGHIDANDPIETWAARLVYSLVHKVSIVANVEENPSQVVKLGCRHCRRPSRDRRPALGRDRLGARNALITTWLHKSEQGSRCYQRSLQMKGMHLHGYFGSPLDDADDLC